MAGIWKPTSGTVRLDGADVYSWDREDFGRNVAYQPQDTELFAGTVRNNIARFLPDATDAQVVAAAQQAGAHDLILRLPKGYETELGEGGAVLSAGQRQRVGLARTLFGDPGVIILDEPNANLDTDGETALLQALERAKQRGATVLLISHKPAIFGMADKILVLVNGQATDFGPRDQVLSKLMKKPQQPQQPPKPDGPAKLKEVGA
jgi:ABC-type protease/lipase transport system fused ATPase/permease subunit